MLHIQNVIEARRSNGYRKPGHKYLVGKKVPYQCCKLPVQLPDYCIPKQGLEPVPKGLFADRFADDTIKSVTPCISEKCCLYFDAMDESPSKMIWINEVEYNFAAFWFAEVRTRPVQLDCFGMPEPQTLIGKNIFIAHRKAIVDYSEGAFGWVDSETKQAHTNIKYFPGIFAMFQVTGLEYVIGDSSPDAKMKKYYAVQQELGFKLVNVVPEEQLEKTGYINQVEDIE